MSPGDKRRRQAKRVREAAAYEIALAVVVATGATCSTCQHYGLKPMGMKKRICELDSDFHGYVQVDPDHVCPRYKLKTVKETQ